MAYNILEKIFGSSSRVKIMKLFLFNEATLFDKESIIDRSKVSPTEAARELKILEDIKLLKKRATTKKSETKTGKISKKKVDSYILNPNFPLMKHLKNLLINNEPLQHADIQKRLNKVGKIKLIVISGVFIQCEDSRVDILVVGEQIKEKSLKNIIKIMESEIGKELRFSFLETEDFKYRNSVCDRLLRDIFDYQHEIVLDKIGLN